MYLADIIFFAAFIYSIVLHEIAHGWVALKCGDPTAKWSGRLTLNPIPHIDPIMSVLVPLVLWVGSHGTMIFGSAKPVPVSLRNLRRHPRDAILVAIAGVATNLLIAIACAVVYQVLSRTVPQLAGGLVGSVLLRTAVMNVFLLVFNLIPIPPLDGSRVFRYFLEGPARATYDSLERYGFLIIILLCNLPIVGDFLATVTGLITSVLFYGAVA